MNDLQGLRILFQENFLVSFCLGKKAVPNMVAGGDTA